MFCRFELAMQQNEIMNVFFDDWMALADNDSSFGSKADNHLKVDLSTSYFSFSWVFFYLRKGYYVCIITCVFSKPEQLHFWSWFQMSKCSP